MYVQVDITLIGLQCIHTLYMYQGVWANYVCIYRYLSPVYVVGDTTIHSPDWHKHDFNYEGYIKCWMM